MTQGAEVEPPLEAIGELPLHTSRNAGHDRDATLKKRTGHSLNSRRRFVLSNNAQVGVARSGYFPQINATAGTEFLSSPLTEISERHGAAIFLVQPAPGRFGIGVRLSAK